jgi:drug/metabolite transporter (DMT)-like permease
LTAAVLFGLSAPAAKLLLGTIEPVTLAGLLYLGCGSGLAAMRVLGGVWGVRQAREARLARADYKWLAGATLAGGVAAPIMMMASLRHTTAAIASLLLNFEGVATVLIAAVLFREAVGRKGWTAAGLITLGGTVLSVEAGGGWAVSPSALGILLACALWGMDNNFTQRISAKDPLVTTTVKGVVAGVVSLTLSLSSGGNLPRLLPGLGALAIGFLSYGLSIYLFILSLRGLGTARTGALFGLAPFIGVAGSLAVFDITIGWQFLAALPLMAAGAYLLLTERHSHAHVHDELEHAHLHVHDEHHQHGHAEESPVGKAHTHAHKHRGLSHRHGHAPDIHHRHTH